MPDTNGAVDLSQYLTADTHDGRPHKMGGALPRPTHVQHSHAHQGFVGDGDWAAVENHQHPIAAAFIRGDLLGGGDDRQFPNQLPELPTSILKGTMMITRRPGDTSNNLARWLAVRCEDAWFGVSLTFDDERSTGGRSYTSIDPDTMK